MAKKKSASKEVEASPLEAVYYTDGGCRPSNPGFAGWGVHGYHYRKTTNPKGTGLPKWGFNADGYYDKTAENKPKTLEPLEIVNYVDGWGTIDGLSTNNVAEIQAAISALQYSQDKNLKSIKIYSDSKQLVEAANGWISKWRSRDWKRADGNPVANRQSWEVLDGYLQKYKDNEIPVSLTWIRSHDGHLGNEAADTLATLGVFTNQKGQSKQQFDLSPAQGYWKVAGDKPALFTLNEIVFMPTEHYFAPGHHLLVTPPPSAKKDKDKENAKKKDPAYGKREVDCAYAYVELKEPDELFETILNYQKQVSTGKFSVMRVDTRVLYRKTGKASIRQYVSKFGSDCMAVARDWLSDICFIDKTPLTQEIQPVKLSMRMFDVSTHLCAILRQSLRVLLPGSYPDAGAGLKLAFTDITDRIYNEPKQGIRSLNGSFASGPTEALFKANVAGLNEPEEIKLYIDLDIPDRGSLKKLGEQNPKIHIVTWLESDLCFRFAVIVMADSGNLIQCTYYANTKYLKTKSEAL